LDEILGYGNGTISAKFAADGVIVAQFDSN
jgi:hypothetical protein